MTEPFPQYGDSSKPRDHKFNAEPVPVQPAEPRPLRRDEPGEHVVVSDDVGGLTCVSCGVTKQAEKPEPATPQGSAAPDLDEMVRDFTRVGPRSKSDVKSRIESYVAYRVAEQRAEIERLRAEREKLRSDVDFWHSAHDGAESCRKDASERAHAAEASVWKMLVAKLDKILPIIDGMCAVEQIHGRPYQGPTITDELAELRAALAAPDVPPEKENGR